MLSDLTPSELTVLSAIISLLILYKLDNEEANAVNNLLALIASNLSVQLAQQELNQEVNNNCKNNKNNNKNNKNNLEAEDITPLFFV